MVSSVCPGTRRPSPQPRGGTRRGRSSTSVKVRTCSLPHIAHLSGVLLSAQATSGGRRRPTREPAEVRLPRPYTTVLSSHHLGACPDRRRGERAVQLGPRACGTVIAYDQLLSVRSTHPIPPLHLGGSA